MPGEDLIRAADLRRLEQFVAVAETGGLADAAARTFVTPQALSVALRQLERDMGVSLFDRSHRRLALTDAGSDLLHRARPLLAGAQHLTRAVRNAAAPPPVPFVVGYSPALSGTQIFELLEPVVKRWGQQSVTFRQVFPDAVTDGLLSGELDVMLRRAVDNPDGLASTTLTYQPLRLAVAATHPLAHRETITAGRDLEGRPIIVWAPERYSFYTDFLVAYCRRAGVEPELRVSRVQGAPPTTAVLLDDAACAFVTDSAGPKHGGRVLVKDFDDPPLSPIQVLWTPHTVSEFRTDLLNSAPAFPSPAGG